MATCLIGAGANLGDRTATIGFAAARLAGHPCVASLRASRCYATPPIGGPTGQAEFLNAAFRIETSLAPRAMLELLQQIEELAGRAKSERWAARRLDLDLLLYDDAIVEHEALVIPHPRMVFRRFVLDPAAEIAGEMTHPTCQRTIAELRARIDTLPHYIAISDAARSERQSLVRDLAAQCQALTLLAPADLTAEKGDSASPDLAAAIEFLERLMQVVAAVQATQQDRIWLSDFWLGDVLLSAQRAMSPEVFSEFEKAWRSRESEMPEPLLVVVFDATKDTLAALQHARLPVLKLDSADPDWNRQEVVAAIEALK